MNHEDALEAEFRERVFLFCLKFKDQDLENEYQVQYSSNGKKTPMWFMWLMWIFIILMGIVRIIIVVFTYYSQSDTLARTSAELVTSCILMVSYIIEVGIIFLKKLSYMKGFAILVACFFTVGYSATNNLTTSRGLIMMYLSCINLLIRSVSTFVFCAYICSWYVYSWIASGAACIIGTGFFTYFFLSPENIGNLLYYFL